jgi:periplasmic copper chaperone A
LLQFFRRHKARLNFAVKSPVKTENSLAENIDDKPGALPISHSGIVGVKAFPGLLVAILLSACHAEPAPMVTVSDPRVIAMSGSAAAYFTLANSGGDDRLMAVEAEGVGRASLHETRFEDGIMRMRRLDSGIAIPNRGRVMLTPGGRHIMIEGIAAPLAPGSHIRLTLRFERQGEVAVNAPVSGPLPGLTGMAM